MDPGRQRPGEDPDEQSGTPSINFKLDAAQILLVNPNDKVLVRWRQEERSTRASAAPRRFTWIPLCRGRHDSIVKRNIHAERGPGDRRSGRIRTPAEVVGYAPVPLPNTARPEPSTTVTSS